MRRRLFALLVGCLSALMLAGAVFADTGPGPGNFRDSGSSVYLNAWSSVCDQSTCTDTSVNAWVTKLKGGDSYTSMCFDQFTYPTRGGGRISDLSGCNDVDATIDVASDLSSGSANALILAQECGRRTCTGEVELSVSADLTAVSDPNAYSYTQKQQYQNCTDTYRVRGEASDAEGSIAVGGSTLDAYGQLGDESFAFSTRCH